MSDFSSILENDVLQELVEDFQLQDLDDQFDVGLQSDQVARVENPSTVECPEDDLVFELVNDLDLCPMGGFKNEFLQQYPTQSQSDSPGQNEGQEIMAGITGFGAASGVSNFQASPSVLHDPFGGIDINNVVVKIIEQPASNKLRFRYKCEGRCAGSLQGENCTNDRKTFPTIQVFGYQGDAVVVVSCVEEKSPYRAHPHNLVGKGGIFNKGVYSVNITNPDMTCQFANLGIQCVKKKEAADSLTMREEIKVDPFKQRFAHKNGPINLNAVRLCFQVFLKNGKHLKAINPVVSDVIYDKKAHTDLQIVEISSDSSPVEGGKKILIFCEKVNKDDIEVHFSYTTKTNEVLIMKGEFTSANVHKQYGISFKTPSFRDLNITTRTMVDLMLYKPSDQSYSISVDFWYEPNPTIIKTERKDHIESIHPIVMAEEPVKNFPQKRGREPQTNPENSSGQIIVPPKAQFYGGGGHVTIMEDKKLFPSTTGNARLDFIQKPYYQIVCDATSSSHYMGSLASGSGSHQELLASIANQQTGQQGMFNQLPLPSVPSDDPHFPNLEISSADLNMSDKIDNLSSSISDMRLDKKTFRQPAAQQRPDANRDSPMLNTPEISLDENLGKVFSRQNNLNL